MHIKLCQLVVLLVVQQLALHSSSASARLRRRFQPVPEVERSAPDSGQCLAISSSTRVQLGNELAKHERVEVDAATGKRSFSAKIVGIFSCLDVPEPVPGGANAVGHHHHQQSQHRNHNQQQQTLLGQQTASNDLTLDFRIAKPVIDLAVKAVNEKYKGDIQFNVTYRTALDICRHQQAAGHAADEYYLHGANYFVGPGCSESLASVSQLASYWNVPVCSTGYLPEMITQRFRPLTLMQLSLSVQSVGEMLLELFQKYKWRHLVIVTDEKHPLHSLIRDGLMEFFHTLYMMSPSSPSPSTYGPSRLISIVPELPATGSAAGTRQTQVVSKFGPKQRAPYYINITSRNFAVTKNTQLADYERVMIDAALHSRIMLLLARSSTITNLLEAAYNQQMNRSKFVFIAHELFEMHVFEQQEAPAASYEQQQQEQQEQQQQQQQPAPAATPSPNPADQAKSQKFSLDEKIEIHSHGNETQDQLIREIFAPLMTISLPIPTTPEFDRFRAQVVSLSEREFNYRLQPSSLRALYSLGLAAFIYDCVTLYADKVDYVLKQTQFSRIDGSTIFELAAGKTFTGALSGDLNINSAGQRVINFTLNSFSPSSLSLEPMAHFHAIQRKLIFLDENKTNWRRNNISVPRSDPRCKPINVGTRPYCKMAIEDDGQVAAPVVGQSRIELGAWLLALIACSVTLTSSIIGWLVYRRFRIESELLNLWWSIKYEDILFEDDACDSKRSMSSLAISNESFPVGAGGSGRTSPHQPQHQHQHVQAAGGGQLAPALPSLANSCDSSEKQQLQLSFDNKSEQQAGLSAAHSASTLSVGAGSQAAARSLNAQATVGTKCVERRQRRFALSSPSAAPASGGVAKLLPLLGKQAGGAAHAAGQQHAAGVGRASGQQTGSNKSVNKQAASAGGAGAAKDPSISSQNKNIKLRLGTVLNGRDRTHTTKVGLYKASRVAVKHLNVKNLSINRQLLIELRQVRDLTHDNLIKFIGLCPDEPNVAIVSELCTRGNLQDLLQNESIRLDWPFRFSIINDIVDGLMHLHTSPVQFHGRLKSSNCVIDNRFVVKLTDFGLPALLGAVEMDEEVNPRLLLWTAPEHLRTKHPLLSGSQKGDIYSLAIILQEIITRCGPFECEPILCGASELMGVTADALQQQQVQPLLPPLIRTTDFGNGQRGARNQRQQAPQPVQLLAQPIVVQHKQRLEPDEIVNLVRMGLSPPFRPYFRPDVVTGSGAPAPDFNVTELIGMVQSCWQESPAARPSVASFKQQIKKLRRGCHLDGTNLMDNLLQRMERYTDNLESLVEQKTAELMEEKKRSEELLYEMLPRFVVDQLKYGHSVTPEAYEAVTISFSDIKDFTSIAAQSSPIEVVNLLNQLYTEFDDCIARYDVYKVETIGDAYMVVSGLPVRNGDLHAKEIAEMSLALLELIRNVDVAHLPGVKLELRIGIHSGPCASGVVGTRMFRYCLFGDTVNTASRMESHGEPMKIHISEDTANVLSRFGIFSIEPRGQIEIKGKGMMSTYWLTGKLLRTPH